MGKFTKALEKGAQHGLTTPERAEDWLEENKLDPFSQNSSTQDINQNQQQDKPAIGSWDNRLFRAVNEDIAIPEIFKILRTRILHPQSPAVVPKTIMVTSTVPKEGKSFVSSNLGISLAHGMDQHSLLVDCDLRRPTLAPLFGLSGAYGLVDYLRGDLQLPDVLKNTVVNKLSLLPSGSPPVNPAELLSSSRMRALIEELSSRYDDRLIIFDTPPIKAAAESGVLAQIVDTVILVVREGVSKKADIQQAIDIIGKGKILGIVYNDQKGSIFDKPYSENYGYYNHNMQ